MTRFKPPLPPAIRANLPTDPFEAWLVRQSVNGHDRHWLRRNVVALKAKWKSDPEADLGIPPREEPKVKDRLDELR